MIKFSLLAAVCAALILTACEGKKSLDGYPMDKPPPSAYAPRDSEPVVDEPDTKEKTNATKENADSTK
jgi:hypothetical protein